RYLADAFGLGNFLREDGGSGVVHLAAVQRVGGGRGDRDRRVGRIHLAVGGIARQAGGQLAARGVDRSLHVARGAVDVAVEVELQRDVRVAERRGRSDLGDAGDAAERALEDRKSTRLNSSHVSISY